MLRALEHHRLVKQSALARLFDEFEFPVTFTNSGNRFVYVNRAFLTFYRYSEAAIIGLSPRVLMPRNFCQKRLAKIDATVAGRKLPWEGTLPNVTADGKLVSIQLLAVPINPTVSPLSSGYLGITCEEGQKHRLTGELLKHLGSFALNLALPTLPKSKEGSYRRGDRQKEVMRLSQMSYSAKEIGTIMGIAASTVANVRWKLTQHGSAHAEPKVRATCKAKR